MTRPQMTLSHVAVGAADLEKSAAFYRDALGLAEAFRLDREDGSPWIVYLDAGPGAFVEVIARRADASAPRPKCPGLPHLCLAVGDLDAAVARLRERGVAIAQEIVRGRDGNRQAWVADPDGNPVELMELAPDGLQEKYRRARS